MHLALGGVVAALVGLLLSLFIRPRRVWVRADQHRVGVGGLDRSTAGDVEAEVAEVVKGLRQLKEPERIEESS
jgi:cytochrome c biogenesis protein